VIRKKIIDKLPYIALYVISPGIMNIYTHETSAITPVKIRPALIMKEGYCIKNSNPPAENTNDATPKTRAPYTNLVLERKNRKDNNTRKLV
jgi:hypothetical protein